MSDTGFKKKYERWFTPEFPNSDYDLLPLMTGSRIMGMFGLGLPKYLYVLGISDEKAVLKRRSLSIASMIDADVSAVWSGLPTEIGLEKRLIFWEVKVPLPTDILRLNNNRLTGFPVNIIRAHMD